MSASRPLTSAWCCPCRTLHAIQTCSLSQECSFNPLHCCPLQDLQQQLDQLRKDVFTDDEEDHSCNNNHKKAGYDSALTAHEEGYQGGPDLEHDQVETGSEASNEGISQVGGLRPNGSSLHAAVAWAADWAAVWERPRSSLHAQSWRVRMKNGNTLALGWCAYQATAGLNKV